MKLHTTILICLMALSASVQGCTWFQSACGAATPAIQQAQIYTEDAEAVIQGTRIAIAGIANIPTDTLVQINKYLGDAETLISEMRVMETAAITSCTSPNLGSIIAGLVTVWATIEPLIAPLLLNKQPLRTPQYVVQARLRMAHK